MKKSFLSLTIALILVLSMATTALAAEFTFVEAETGTLSGMFLVDDAQAYGGKYITSDDVEQGVDFTFEIPKDGKYTAWFRVYATMDTDNSVFFSIDGDSYSDDSLWILDFHEPSEYEINPDDAYVDPNYNNPDVCYDRWYWLRLSFRDAGASPATRFNTKFYDLTAGTHTLRIQSREAGARIDKILFTDNIDYNPNNETGDPEAAYLAEIAAAEAAAAAETAAAQEEAVKTPEPASAPKTSDSLNIFIIILAASAFSGSIVLKKRRASR